jgi:hypothetical protein
MAPVVKEFQKHPEQIETVVCVTDQHCETGEIMDAVYFSVITAGTHLAPTIKLAKPPRPSRTHNEISTLPL